MLHVVVAEEKDESKADRIEMENSDLTDAQKTDLDRFLDKHADVVCKETSKVSCIFHAIDTGTATSSGCANTDWLQEGGCLFSFRGGHSQTLP